MEVLPKPSPHFIFGMTMKKLLMTSICLIPLAGNAETLEGTVLDVQALTVNKTVSIPHKECGMVKKVVPIRKGVNRVYHTDDVLSRLFKTVTAPTATFYVEECNVKNRDEVRAFLEGYIVTYTLNDKIYQTRTRIRPEGGKIQVRVSHEIQ
jgi:hypothetical protein